MKLKNLLKEQDSYKASATNTFFSDNQKKIYEHVLEALAEQLIMTADEVDDHCENNKQYDNALKQIVMTIEKLAQKIESEF